jgi:hypothetical protein
MWYFSGYMTVDAALRLAVNDPATTTGRHKRDGRSAKQTSLDSTAPGPQGLLINRTNIRTGCMLKRSLRVPSATVQNLFASDLFTLKLTLRVPD